MTRAFQKYPSFQKAKVIRDKRTSKTKGYGFVSFKDSSDFIKAMREMDGMCRFLFIIFLKILFKFKISFHQVNMLGIDL